MAKHLHLLTTAVSVLGICCVTSLAETLSIPADGTTVTSSMLEDGHIYQILATGTYAYNISADAEFSDRGGVWVEYEPSWEVDWLDIWIDGQAVDWEGWNGAGFAPHTYSQTHTYRHLVVGTGASLSFAIPDTYYGDNSGSLTVRIDPMWVGPVQWPVSEGGNGHWYEIREDGSGKLSWNSANALAQAQTYLGVQGQLASITSAAENEFIISHLLTYDRHHAVLIGAFRTDASSPWQWTDGEACEYVYWDPGEPMNNWDDTAVAIFSNVAIETSWASKADVLGGWNDIPPDPLNLNFGYIVEYPAPSAPQIECIDAPLDPVQVGTLVGVGASFSDADPVDSHSAQWDWGDGTCSPGAVDQANDTVSGTHIYTAAGAYTVTLTVTDLSGQQDTDAHEFVVVYNPGAGFVTGGGWLESPSGACVLNPTLTGRANIGFVSKYLKGATVPTGNTEFQFKTGNLNFHSSSYEWLVVNQGGTNAQYKGSGTINGTGSYKFMLWAGDGTPDTFRIKIWSEDENGAEQVVYDNGVAQPIGGGSIVIHTR